jgi:hypothetical protein
LIIVRQTAAAVLLLLAPLLQLLLLHLMLLLHVRTLADTARVLARLSTALLSSFSSGFVALAVKPGGTSSSAIINYETR